MFKNADFAILSEICCYDTTISIGGATMGQPGACAQAEMAADLVGKDFDIWTVYFYPMLFNAYFETMVSRFKRNAAADYNKKLCGAVTLKICTVFNLCLTNYTRAFRTNTSGVPARQRCCPR